ncbi:MFS transporter [Stenotrophomonas chelatiphaga]|uniref:MFS transporter n=1 Tax=Stenotrophomonas chelatiphaga TaxID=517011 RepID=A0A0R0DC65_9GAMM|nr:MFS transporter [Stenotrophomonas chelatiphaga]KRG75866.1 MFS transporter [Stenotrophomonas chelatiphaga]MCS4230573.1 MFS family permease [Stenotrophomonas chelatiphaga]ROQ45555.1 putative MFS family arabinose efflux permease [Stenotrophomonas maltophilia]
MVNTASPAAPGAWAPLQISMFRALWLAIMGSNIGTWVNDVAAAWVMAERTGSPLMVALVQSATTVPIVLLALVAGTLADIVDRRRYLLATQGWMLAVAGTMAVLTHLDLLSPTLLVVLTFCMGCGAAMAMPAQAAIVSELVPPPMLASAVALNSIGINIARSLGPAIGGVIVAQLGATWAFGFNAISFAAMLVVLLRWQRDPKASSLPPEGFGAGLKSGLRYASRAGHLQAVLIKSAGFFFFASAMTALLPVVVRGQMQGGAGQYGMLLGCVGIGAVSGALLLPKLRARLDRDLLVLLATLALALSLVGLAVLRSWVLLPLAMLVNGFAWITVLSSLQIAAQTAVPAWVRARALALYIMVFSLGMAAGGLCWGALAQRSTPTLALLVAAVGAVVAGLLVWRVRISGTEELDLRPAGHWPAPELSVAVGHDRGPVLVTVEYRIDAADRVAFHACMRLLGRVRRRDGAVLWGVAEDVASPGVHLEYFVTASWLEHLRQHERITADDKAVQEQLRTLHRGERHPVVRHFVGGSDALDGAVPHTHSDI